MKQTRGGFTSGCAGKDSMLRDVAEKVARRMKRRIPAAHCYRCHYCGGWHVAGTKRKDHKPR